LLHDRRAEELSHRVVSQFLRDRTALSGTTIPRRAQTIRTWIRDVSDFDPLEPLSLAQKAASDAEEQYRAYRAREEGPLHRELKRAISEDPLSHLGERLTLIQIEYPFPTNDRADVLFLDQRKRLYVVEVEVDVGPRDLPGLLQAIKYKHMLAAINGLEPSEVRGVLVARKIDPAIETRARLYGIECKRVAGVI
jgi:RecB family endonuclease NucS